MYELSHNRVLNQHPPPISDSERQLPRATRTILAQMRSDWVGENPEQPCSQDFGLASHTTHVVWVNFIRKWRDLQFNVDSEQQIFEKLFNGRFIYSQSFCQKSAEVIFFSYFVLISDLGSEPRSLGLKRRHTTY